MSKRQVALRAPAPFDDPKCADFIIRTRDGVDFHIYKAILSIASPFLREMFSLTLESGASASNIPFVEVEEASSTWDQLLRFFYPTGQPPSMDNLKIVGPLLAASTKYMMADTKMRIVHALLSHPALENEPMRMYAIAAHHNLHDLMRAAAKASLNCPILQYPFCAELKRVTAASLCRLQEYHVACGTAAASVALAPSWQWCHQQRSPGKYVFIHYSPTRRPGGCQCATGLARCVSAATGETYYYGLQYLDEYLSNVAADLKIRPSPTAVTAPKSMSVVFDTAGQCFVCRPRIHEDLTAFAEILRNEVAKVISEVCTIHYDSEGPMRIHR